MAPSTHWEFSINVKMAPEMSGFISWLPLLTNDDCCKRLFWYNFTVNHSGGDDFENFMLRMLYITQQWILNCCERKPLFVNRCRKPCNSRENFITKSIFDFICLKNFWRIILKAYKIICCYLVFIKVFCKYGMLWNHSNSTNNSNSIQYRVFRKYRLRTWDFLRSHRKDIQF